MASRLLLSSVYVNVSESSGQGCSCCRVIEQINSKHNEVDLLSMSTRFYCALTFFSHPCTALRRAISITLDNRGKSVTAELRPVLIHSQAGGGGGGGGIAMCVFNILYGLRVLSDMQYLVCLNQSLDYLLSW